nr:SRPBCC domain-containing protein [Ferruginibacter sp.]
SMGFDFWGIYDVVKPHEYIEMTLGDDRKVKIYFKGSGNQTHIVETFEAEGENPIEMQRAGWQAILDNFKQYTETN